MSLAALVALGYQVGVAYGDARPEHARLAELEAAAAPDALMGAAQNVGADVARELRRHGKRGPELIAAVTEAIETAHAHFSDHVERALEHQRRAIEIAEAMPTVYRIEGHGISTLVSDDDEETFAALADPDAHKQRLKAVRDVAKAERDAEKAAAKEEA